MCASVVNVDPGQGRHTKIYYSEGYSYYVNCRVVNENNVLFETLYLRCSKYHSTSSCVGRAVIRKGPEGDQWVNTQQHSCLQELYASHERWLRHDVMEASRTEPRLHPRQLFNALASQYPLQVAEKFSNHYVRNSMRAARLELYPKSPNTLNDLGHRLEQPQYKHISACIEGNDSVYAATVGPPGHQSVIFISKRLRMFLSNVSTVFADVTFVPTPVKPHGCQVYQISTLSGHNVIPLIQVIMESKSYIAYRPVLEKVDELVPRFKPRIAMMDYERNPMKAWIDVFHCLVRGCYFHFVQAVIKKSRKLKMTSLLSRDLRARALLSYFWSTWLTGYRYETLSVYNQDSRTNNASVTANSNLLSEIGPHRPNIYRFINAIRRCEWAAYVSSRRARRFLSVGRRQKVSTLRNDRVIRNATAELLSGNVSLKRFLRVTSTRVINVFHQTLGGIL